MPDNRSNQRTDNARNDNDAFGSPSRSGRGGSWSNRDDDDMQMRNTRSDRPRSAYDSELNARMEQGGSHTSAYGDEYSVSGDRYRNNDATGKRGGERGRDRDREPGRNMGGSSRGEPDMGADSWGGGADRDTGRDSYNRDDAYGAGSHYGNRRSEHINDRDIDRDDYYGNRSMNDNARKTRTSVRDDFNRDEPYRGRGGQDSNAQQSRGRQEGGYGDRYSGREGGSNQFSSWRNDPSDMRGGSMTGGRSAAQWDQQGGMRANSQMPSEFGMQRGQHAGRGPKGYRRDDARITEDVNEALTHDGHIDASEIEVSVSGGEVTLSGTVDSREAKRHAEDIVESVSGVNEVNNQIRVLKANSSASSRSNAGSDRLHGSASTDRETDYAMSKNTDKDNKQPSKSGATEGTSTADGARSAQGSGPSGAANTSTSNTNPAPKSIPSTQGTSAHKTGDKGAQ